MEDEPPIRRAVKKLIEQTNPAFSVTATAADGAIAADLLDKEPFDIVFTDIRMPVMDGLALLESIRAGHPGIVAVVLSGYGEFEYAQKALKSQAYDYLLKPISPEQLAALLKKLERDVHERKGLERKRLISSTMNKSADETVSVRALDGRLHAVMLICVGPFLYDDGDFLSPGAAFWDGKDAGAIAAEALGGGAVVWAFRGETPADRIVVVELPPEGSVRDAIYRVFERMGSVCDIPVTVMGYAGPVDVQSVGKAYRALRKGLLPAVRIGRSSVSWVDGGKIPDAGSGGAGFRDADEERTAGALAAAVRAGSAAGIRENLVAAMTRFGNEGGSQHLIARFFQAVLDGCLGSFTISPETDAKRRREIQEAISGSVSMEMLFGNALAVLLALAEEGTSPRKASADRNLPVVGRIEAYLRQHYTEPITNLTLSHEFGFVPSYVSRIFREHTGQSVSDRLVQIRMVHAKRLMEDNPGILVKEVADRIGFKDQYHFSKTFKKQTGVWPTEYRR